MTTFAKLLTDEIEDIRGAALQARARLGSPAESATVGQVLAKLDAYLLHRFSEPATPEESEDQLEDLAFECGALWGEQLVQGLHWQWIRVQFNDQAPEAVGVASADASLVIYPFQTIFLCHEQLLPVRVARSFEVLSEPGRVPMLPLGGLENVMDHIH